MMDSEVIGVLVTIVLILAAVVGLGLVIALAVMIKFVLEVFAIARLVRTEVSTVAATLRVVGEKVSGSASSALGILGVLRGAKKKATKKATK